MMDDLISRQAAIDAINKEMDGLGNLDPTGWGMMVARDCIIEKLPSAQPERPKGQWIERDCGLDVECKCSVCGYKDFIPSPYDRYWFKRKFCPNCGAKMEVEHEPD